MKRRILRSRRLRRLPVARIDGLSLSPGYRSFDRLQPGETKLVFRVHTMQPQSVYNGFTEL